MISGFSVGIISLALSGCAAYELQPLSANHPASLQAVSAPAPARSKTLAYSRADMPSVAYAAAEKSEHDAHHSDGKGKEKQTVVGEGKVVAAVPGSSQVVLEHGEIKGFMEPMTMGYRIDPPSQLEGLKPGDQVRFTIDVPKKTIVKIEKMK
jgi:Cu/Ag efflux protein CusF